MGNFIIANSFATISAYVKDTENASFPATNVGDYSKPYVPWRATTLTNTTTYVGLDFGVNTTLTAVVVDNLNVTSVKVQHSSDGSSWSDDATVTVSQDLSDGRYKFWSALSTWTYRYLRLLLNTTTTTDSTNTMMVGTILPITSYTTLGTNISGSYDRTSVQAIEPVELAGGGRAPVKLGERYTQLALSAPAYPYTTATEADIWKLIGSYEPQDPFVFYHNLSSTAEVYICRRVGSVTISQRGPAHSQVGTILLEEVV
jgi:hypothetical protein